MCSALVLKNKMHTRKNQATIWYCDEILLSVHLHKYLFSVIYVVITKKTSLKIVSLIYVIVSEINLFNTILLDNILYFHN